MKHYMLSIILGYSTIIGQGGDTQAPAPEQALSALSKEQLIELIQILSTPQQQKAAPVQVTPVVVATPALATLPMPNPGAECAHFVTDMLGQVVTIAIAQDPLVTVNGVTNIVHNLISLIVQQHQNQKRSRWIDNDNDEENQDLNRYELLQQVLTELEELMEELQDIDIAIQEIEKDF